MKNTQIYNYVIPANGSVQILTEGSYFRILSSTGPVEVDADTYGNIIVLAGQGVKDQPFRRLFLNDKSGATNTISLLVSDGSFVDDRITGEVSVIDGSYSRADSGLAYNAGAASAIVAGQYGHVQLWNTPGSGSNIYVTDIIAGSDSVTAQMSLRTSTATLANSSGSAFNKKVNAAPSTKFLVYSEANVAMLGATYGLRLTTGAQNGIFKPIDPICVPPGYGLLIGNNAVNVPTVANFQFFERSL